MRILKDEKYSSILQAARQEFVREGFKEASMRNIARQAGVGLSNIYNYFRNKDEIFGVIVSPAKHKLFSFITEQHTEATVDFSAVPVFGHHEEAIEYYIELIDQYREEYRMLLYYSQGSSRQDFRDELTDHMTRVSHHYMEMEKEYYPEAAGVSDFFIHTMSSWMVSILGEMVTHDDMDRPKIRDFFREYFRFSFAGWRELMGI